MVRIAAFHLPPVAALGVAAHAGHLDRLVDDPLLGAWCGGIVAVYLMAVAALARGNADLAQWIGRRLTLLGFLGTLHGFTLAFGAVAIAGDLEATKAAIGALTAGLSVAIYTTIVGLVCKLWLDLQARWCV